jgi:hypothetical protein
VNTHLLGNDLGEGAHIVVAAGAADMESYCQAT